MKEKNQEAVKEFGSFQNPYLSMVVALIFPGAGHFLLGRKARAVAFTLIVLSAAMIGVLLEGQLYETGPGQPLAFLATLAEMALGLPYFVLRFVVGYQGNLSGVGFEYGKAFILTAGLMNLLLVLDAWDIARGAKE